TESRQPTFVELVCGPRRSCPFSAQRTTSRSSWDAAENERGPLAEFGVWPLTVGYGDELVENRLVGHFQLQLPQQLAETTFSGLPSSGGSSKAHTGIHSSKISSSSSATFCARPAMLRLASFCTRQALR